MMRPMVKVNVHKNHLTHNIVNQNQEYPVIQMTTVDDQGTVTLGNEAVITDDNGEIVARLVYDHPSVYILTYADRVHLS